MLQEALKGKKDISQTKPFGNKYQEIIIRKTTAD